jgi:hypothetical protein
MDKIYHKQLFRRATILAHGCGYVDAEVETEYKLLPWSKIQFNTST